MSELISGREAIEAFLDGENVEFMDKTGQWRTMLDNTILKVFLDHDKFRLKPRTITINASDVPYCYSMRINRTEGRIEIDFRNTGDADAAYKVLKEVFRF